MRNRPFELPLLESDWLMNNELPDMGILKNRFAGQSLFKYSYFDLLNGDTTVLTSRRNKWLQESILNNTVSKQDRNLIPVIQMIAADTSLEEGIRQRSSEILEMPWAENNILTTGKKSFTVHSGQNKSINEDIIFSGLRTPQTSEILKLLRSRSIESKREAICLIGKFRLTDMVHEVSEYLTVPGLETDSAAVLRFFGNESGGALRRLYLKSSGNINTCKAILRILCRIGGEENVTFLFERLWSNSREIKETALRCLIDREFKVNKEEINRFNKLISEVTGTLAWILCAQICVKKENIEYLTEILDKEIIRWKRFLYNLLVISLKSDYVKSVKNPQSEDDADFNEFITGLIDIIFKDSKKPMFGFIPRSSSADKTKKKLHQFFYGEIPDCKNLTDDLLNRDYNQISVWTKACTLRNLKDIGKGNLCESVVALMFSPEGILQEEAARLIAGSDLELYRSVSQRIQVQTKIRLDRIINKETHEKELLLNKTMFLSSIFPGIPEEKLLFLAKAMKFTRILQAEFQLYTEGCILWSFTADVKYPENVKVIFNANKKSDRFSMTREGSHFYILDLHSVEEFHYLFPEHSFEIFKYVDDIEGSEN